MQLSPHDVRTLRWSAAYGLTAVAIGAFGAHALKARLSSEALDTLDIAVRYQLWHTLAMLGTVALGGVTTSPWRERAAWAFAAGIGLFSGSLYVLTLVGRWALPGSLVLVTPLGGLLLMIGWAFLFLSTPRTASSR